MTRQPLPTYHATLDQRADAEALSAPGGPCAFCGGGGVVTVADCFAPDGERDHLCGECPTGRRMMR